MLFESPESPWQLPARSGDLPENGRCLVEASSEASGVSATIWVMMGEPTGVDIFLSELCALDVPVLVLSAQVSGSWVLACLALSISINTT